MICRRQSTSMGPGPAQLRWADILTKRLGPWIDSWQPYGTKVMTVLERVSDWHRVSYDEVHEIRPKQWSNPPVFLVGDAAHAMTPNYGQGANCAMVDALVLITLLARAFQDGLIWKRPLERTNLFDGHS